MLPTLLRHHPLHPLWNLLVAPPWRQLRWQGVTLRQRINPTKPQWLRGGRIAAILPDEEEK
eukprot:5290742-Pyramimonas_sp.AAC.1